MKVLLVDDEKAARERMKRLLARYNDVVVIGEAQNGGEALQLAASLLPDVVFLDIEMPGLDGLAVARALPRPGPRIVFVTAYDQFALLAFEAAAADYLVKPVADERLAATVQRLRQDVGARQSDAIAVALEKLAAAKPISNRFAIKSGSEYHVVDADKVTAIVAQDHYSIVKADMKELLCDEPLGALAARLDGQRFIRVHRNAIVNLSAVERLEREGDRKFVLVLRDGSRVPVSRERTNDVKSALCI